MIIIILEHPHLQQSIVVIAHSPTNNSLFQYNNDRFYCKIRKPFKTPANIGNKEIAHYFHVRISLNSDKWGQITQELGQVLNNMLLKAP